ncbi:MAG: TetR family transcriptional regulator [Acidimicrobiia bacterium]|nr:TetR family transcriptional regulator [Acidimicrobiia bacterium]
MRSAADLPTDDRTTKARIRDAAIECFAAEGIAATSIRAIAASAGVSAGLVMHHFGSKDELRVACDEYVAAFIRETKTSAMSMGAGIDPLAALRSALGGPPLLRYLARTLVDGSPHVAELVDEFVDDAVGYMEVGVETGLIQPSEMPRQRAALLTIWSLGGIVLYEHMERLLGVDITSDFSQDPQTAATYVAAALDVFGGLFTDTTKELWGQAFADSNEETKETE